MRFKKIEEFNVDSLLLDEGNYRFKKAIDQKACIEKIYSANPQYFRGLMESIATDDLGEPLLVYRDKKENVVLDGNRRLAALKVLRNDKFAPSENLKNLAQELREKNNINFLNIQGQVSEDKKLILHTVYERHAGGKTGKARIPWNAYAAARFGYFEEIGDNKEWHIVTLVTRTEEVYPALTEFLDGKTFSYEVFRRVVREALRKGIISENIFSERNKRIKETAKKELIDDAVNKAYKFLLSMKGKEISLSRSGNGYADKDKIDSYLKKFKLSPDNLALNTAKAASQNNSDTKTQKKDDTSDDTNDNKNSSNDQNEETGSGSNDNQSQDKQGKNKATNHLIKESVSITKKLKEINSTKLINLYYSLHTISLNVHPQIMYVGAWSFFEVLSKLFGNENQEFSAFYGNKMQSLGIDKQTGKDCAHALNEILRYGNATKHSKNATPMSAIQLKNNFEVLEPLIVKLLDKLINEKKAAA